jgi:LysR family glycine cleavage system transcriptional activator
MRKLPPLAAVRAFEAAARHENFSRAAEELALTQAGVSYQIKLLEERLGTQLFARKGRGMALTSTGRRIAPRVTEAFTMLDDAFSTVRAENESILTITAPRSFATNWLARHLGSFNLIHPDLAVRLDVSDEIVDLAAGEFDMAIRGVDDPAPTPGLIAHFLMRQHATPMASPAFLERHPLSTPADLLNVPRISPDDEWWDLWFGSASGISYAGGRKSGIRFDSQVLDGQAAIAGHGAAVLSPMLFQQSIETGLLVQPFSHLATDRRSIWLVYPEHKQRMTKVRAFRNWLFQALKQAAGDDAHGVLRPLGEA